MFSEDILDCNLPENLIENIQDVELLHAHERAIASNSITPLLKQELRYKIQSRRLTEGKDELVETQTSAPNMNYELTAREVEKRGRRRKQNRQAAKRFREKKKDELDISLQDLENLQAKNNVLRVKLESLIREKDKLVNILKNHLRVCKNKTHGEWQYVTS